MATDRPLEWSKRPTHQRGLSDPRVNPPKPTWQDDTSDAVLQACSLRSSAQRPVQVGGNVTCPPYPKRMPYELLFLAFSHSLSMLMRPLEPTSFVRRFLDNCVAQVSASGFRWDPVIIAGTRTMVNIPNGPQWTFSIQITRLPGRLADAVPPQSPGARV